jgi:hypothetical protein
MSMTSIEQEFQSRVSRIPQQGLGLSVDVYTPDVFEVVEALDQASLSYGYLEMFKASQGALADLRRRLPHARLQYHAEGIWITQPGLERSAQFDTALTTAAEHLATLGCAWMNHECAAKQMAGYSFGTYLPPLFIKASADVVAENATLIQRCLAASGSFAAGCEPLLLIEIPPLTYFGFGDMSVAEFFRRVTAQAPCGLVLDIGHVWTIYRYTGEWRCRGLTEFLTEFLEAFPLDRVVQIHLAGLEAHEEYVEKDGLWCGPTASLDRCARRADSRSAVGHARACRLAPPTVSSERNGVGSGYEIRASDREGVRTIPGAIRGTAPCRKYAHAQSYGSECCRCG